MVINLGLLNHGRQTIVLTLALDKISVINYLGTNRLDSLTAINTESTVSHFKLTFYPSLSLSHTFSIKLSSFHSLSHSHSPYLILYLILYLYPLLLLHIYLSGAGPRRSRAKKRALLKYEAIRVSFFQKDKISTPFLSLLFY